ncbi:MAG TPA: tRNA uridine-5-carboxymethylaminomethyl(34) synthesis enzyme MnmG [Chthoniobacterales bacterium]|nr:tRNA uridine-5-carboxymethylaminomethyl(34) synthesis enzyme MnmG [Chthoniobacterales bacterium]
MYELPKKYDLIVIGSGHAGVEAALAATRLGCSTLLLTQNLDTVAQMSCNPAIGGLAKGHIVREIDALGGAMGVNADATGIQFRMLNRTKGPSVRAPRAQCDKKAYQFRMKAVLERAPGLDLKQATVSRIRTNQGCVAGVETDIGLAISARTIVVTSGTFLRGLLHVGENSKPGGRMADTSSGLSGSLKELGFEVGRFKTGTPCRISSRSVDFSRCERQTGDDPPPRFSFLPLSDPPIGDIFTLNRHMFHMEQLPCWLTHTTAQTHEIIRQNLHRSPLYSGRIQGTGPRYCPSIEDKIVKFAGKRSHQVFLEPEGRHTEEFYVNGLSTSLPYDVQVELIQSIPGLERAELMRPGYAVEYDFFPPTQLHLTLETKLVEGLYFAGQVNGTSGYEEAAAQGLIAGANAALKVRKGPPFIISRREAYIGVLIDDLTTNGTDEPYRMFTSRAEERLSLRQDNADQRLTQRAFEIGLIDQERHAVFSKKMVALEALRKSIETVKVAGKSVSALLKMADFRLATLPPEVRELASPELWELVETDLKYEGYVRRQAGQNEKLARGGARPIPSDIDYDQIRGLRLETRQKLAAARPDSIGQAGRLSGITPADLSIISIWLEKNPVSYADRPQDGAFS